MSKYRNHPIVKNIIGGLTKLNLPNISWSKDVLVASLNGECQANTEPSNVCIALHFNFDLEDEEYQEHMQVVTVESCIKGGGTGLVSTVMDCLPEDMKVCVYDSTEGEAKTFLPKMAAKYPNIVRYQPSDKSRARTSAWAFLSNFSAQALAAGQAICSKQSPFLASKATLRAILSAV